ncbi:UNVERIFIED_CONTAM: hypothetical protein FKN15_075901 [Acipenser sinensis]
MDSVAYQFKLPVDCLVDEDSNFTESAGPKLYNKSVQEDGTQTVCKCPSKVTAAPLEASHPHGVAVTADEHRFAAVTAGGPASEAAAACGCSQKEQGGEVQDYVKEEDMLDILFDSGTSWAAMLEEPECCADVYLEGKDQLGLLVPVLAAHQRGCQEEGPLQVSEPQSFTVM